MLKCSKINTYLQMFTTTVLLYLLSLALFRLFLQTIDKK